MKATYDDHEVEVSESFREALLRVMREYCAMMRAQEPFPDCWESGRCYLENLENGPTFSYGMKGDFADDLGDFAIVMVKPEPLPASPGDAAHYVLPSGAHRDAVIIDLWHNHQDKCICANLHVRWQPGDERSTYAGGKPVVHAEVFDPGNKRVGTWHLPEPERILDDRDGSKS